MRTFKAVTAAIYDFKQWLKSSARGRPYRMYVSEPLSVAIVLTVVAVLIAASVALSQASQWTGVPVVLLFLALGVIAGEEGVGHIAFHNYRLSFDLGTAALVLILFDGGLNTPLTRIRAGIRPAAVLATAGVAGTAALVSVGARLFGFSWTQAMLLGAIVSPTDASAVFSILRGSGVRLKKRVGVTLELESGLNDPMAVIMTFALTRSLVEHRGIGLATLAEIPIALAVGAGLGLAIGYAGRFMLQRMSPPAGGLYPVLTIALAFIAFGLPSILRGSGFLAAYVAAVVIGNGPMPYRGGILRVHDSVAWLCQLTMFLLLGLLVRPSQLMAVAVAGLAIGVFLAVIARPATVLLCLMPFRYPMREVGFVGWVGLRGAVPIILATYPVLAGAHRIFNVVFFVVVVNTLLTGSAVRWMTRWLGLESHEPPPPPAMLEVTSTRMLTGGEVISFFVEASSAVSGASLSDLPLPPESAVILLIRGRELIAPRGATVLTPGDHVYVLCTADDRSFVQLIFGRAESE
jgi:cell volume regulation protein A